MRSALAGLALAFLILFILAAPPALAFTSIANAQAVVPDTRVDFGPILGAWRPFILDIVTVIGSVVFGWIAMLLRTRFNLEIEAKHREAFQTALTNAAGLVLDRGETIGAGIDVKNVAIAEAVETVLKRVPDAVGYFGATKESIRLGIEAKLGLAKAGHA